MTQIGKLRRPVLVENRIGMIADFGGSTEEWGEYFLAWAEILPLTGAERIEAQQVHPQVTHRVLMRCRWDKPVATTHRLRFGSRIFDIASVTIQDERDAIWDLLVVEHP